MARVPSEFRLVLEAHSLSLKELAPLKWPHLLHTVIAGRVAKSGEGRATLSSSGLAGISKRRCLGVGVGGAEEGGSGEGEPPCWRTISVSLSPSYSFSGGSLQVSFVGSIFQLDAW